MNDLRCAIRHCLAHPGFSLVTILTLALGIGANSAMFSIVQGVLLAPLPYPNPDRLVTLWERDPSRGIEQDRVSGPNYLDWRAQNSVLEDLGLVPGWDGVEQFNLVQRDGTVRIRASYASSSLFTTLGSAPLLGRTLSAEEDVREGPRVAVLSHGLWQRQFAGDSNILGRTLTLDTYGRRDYTIVGVMPPGFGQPGRIEMWLPMGWMGVSISERRDAHWHQVIARLKPGVTVDQARAELSGIQARIQRAYPGLRIGSEVTVVPMIDQAVGAPTRLGLLVLWAVVGLVLLIACANLASLVLTRALARRQELGIRLALGAGRWRLTRLLLVESLLLSLAGGTAGLLLATAGVQWFVTTSPLNLPRLDNVGLDATVTVFTLLISILAGVSFGLAPAWHATRLAPGGALREAARGASAGRATQRARAALVITQVALSLILLAGAGLMLQTLGRLMNADRGIESRRLLAVDLDFSVSGFTGWTRPTPTRPQVALSQLMAQLRMLPGVEAVGAGSRLLRRANQPAHETFAIHGRALTEADAPPTAYFSGVSPGWTTALGLRQLRGRDVAESDVLESPGIVLVNEAFARQFFPGQDPVGQYVKMGRQQPPLNATNRWGQPEWSRIVGVVTDAKSLHPQPQALPEIYASYWQWPMQSPTVFVRTTGEPASVAQAVRRQVAATLPSLPAPVIRTMDDLVDEVAAPTRFQAVLLGGFSLLALGLTATGISGVLALSVGQRTRELGIRMVLGADRRRIVALVLRQGMGLVFGGTIVGLLGSLLLTRVMRGILYGVVPHDPRTHLAAISLLVGTTLVACWIPSRRAARVDPASALKAE